MSLPIRRVSRHPGRAPIRRASAGVSAARIGAGVVAIAMAAAVYGVLVSPAFALGRVDVSGEQYTSEDAVRGALGLAPDSHPNLFGLNTERLRAALLKLPTVTDAEVRAVLPDRLEVRLVERVPVLAWRIGATRYLVDADGIVVAAFPSSAPGAATGTATGPGASADPGASAASSPGASGTSRPSASPSASRTVRGTPAPSGVAVGTTGSPGAAGSSAAPPSTPRPTPVPGASGPVASGAPGATPDPEGLTLPTFVDQRSKRPSLSPGDSLDPTDLAVARLLGTLTPKAVGSKAPSLRITITDRDGFVIDAGTGRWRAIFGMYTATLRSPNLIPAQVQCLRSLLGTGESKIQLIYLFPDGDQCGTFTKKSST